MVRLLWRGGINGRRAGRTGQGDGQSQQGQIPYGQLEGVGGADCLNGQARKARLAVASSNTRTCKAARKWLSSGFMAGHGVEMQSVSAAFAYLTRSGLRHCEPAPANTGQTGAVHTRPTWAAPAGRLTGIKLRGERVRFRAFERQVNELHVRAAIRLAALLVQRVAAGAKVAVLIAAAL